MRSRYTYTLNIYIYIYIMETDRDKVWYPVQHVVPLQWIPNIAYTNNQTYNNLLVKKKRMFFLNENKKN